MRHFGFVLGIVGGIALTWIAQAASQTFNRSAVSSFPLRTPTYISQSSKLTQPEFQVLYDNNGSMKGEAYQDTYGRTFLYDSAGRYQGMVQDQPHPVSNGIRHIQ